jgi:hypothetical protein
MKKSHLKQFIKEEIRSVLQESINEAKEKWVVYDTKTKKRLPNAGKTWVTMKAADAFAAKQKNAKVASAEFYFDKIQEPINESDNWKTVKIKSGDTLKPGKKYTMPRYDGEITFIRFDRDNKTMHLKSNKIGKIRTSIDNAKDMVLVESINEGFLADLPTWVWTLSYAAPFIWMTWEILVSGFEDGKLRRKLSPSGWVELIKLFLKKSKTKQIINTLSQDPEIKSMMGDVKSGKEKQWKLKNLLSKKMSDKQKDVVKQEFDSIAKRLLNKESVNEDKEWSSYEQRMVNQIKAAKKEGLGMYQLPMKTQDFYRKHKDKFDEPINEDQFEASLDDKKKYKMGSMWFKRWFKPKKEQDGWTWEDDGRYIWLTRPSLNKPTVRFEKETGLLQGNWMDPREMQWE